MMRTSFAASLPAVRESEGGRATMITVRIGNGLVVSRPLA